MQHDCKNIREHDRWSIVWARKLESRISVYESVPVQSLWLLAFVPREIGDLAVLSRQRARENNMAEGGIFSYFSHRYIFPKLLPSLFPEKKFQNFIIELRFV